MNQIIFIHILVLTMLLSATRALAVEIYSIVSKNCSASIGPIVYVSEDEIYVLTYSGQVNSVRRDDISIVSRYQTQYPPQIRGMKVDRPILFEAVVQGDPTVFKAFAIGFVENLALFLDQDGRIRVVELESINSLRLVDGQTGEEGAIPESKKIPAPSLAPSGFDHCHENSAKGGIVATADISDPFRVKVFLDRMRQGYRELENLAERTMFYARPLLFDRKNRLGITGHGDTQLPITGSESGAATFPIYFETGSGTPYRFQSSFAFGSFIPRMSPDTAPMFAVRSEFKSHLIHGSFVGNLLGITAGKRLFNAAFPYSRAESFDHAEPWIFSRYNHLTLLGADYGGLTLSYGYYFPVFGIGFGATTIEARPPNASPVFHAGYSSGDWKIEGLTYLTSFREEFSDPKDAAKVSTEYGGGTVNWQSQSVYLSKLSIQSQSIKVLTTYDGFSNAILGLDCALNRTQAVVDSHPFASGQAANYDKRLNMAEADTDKLYSSKIEANVFIRKDLGRSVALRGEASLIYEKLRLKSESSVSRDLDRKLRNYLLALELLL